MFITQDAGDIDYLININCILISYVSCISKYIHLSYIVTVLQAINDGFKVVIDYRKVLF